MFSGHGFEWLGGCAGPGQQLVDGAIGMPIDDLCQHIGEVGVRFDTTEFVVLNQRGNDSPVVPTKPLSKKVDDKADEVRVERALENKEVVRDYAETRHKAKSWSCARRAVARIEATALGLDIRFVVTNLEHGSAEWLYDSLYCARGQAENLIKLHKTQLSSDRTSCRSAIANQVRLVLHTAAYWLMLTVRDAIPKTRDLAKAEFATLRLRLIKIAARVTETARRVRLAFAACHPEAELFANMPGALAPLGP